MPLLKTYLRLLDKNLSPFDCPHCKEAVLAKHFEQHCFAQHHLPSQTNCVWCFGNTFWNKHTQQDRVDHLVTCYSSFLSSRETHPPIPIQPPSDIPTLFNLEPMCKEKMFGNHLPLPNLPETPVWTVEPSVKGLTFQCPRINLAVACLQLYLNLKQSSDWMHIMVKPSAYLSFLNAVNADAGKTRTLPFSCFCAGGGIAHRHFILFTTPRNHFLKTTWKKINCSKKSDNIKRDVIHSPMQLVYLMGSLSQCHSMCHFSFYDLGPEPVGELNHYYINTSLPSIYKVILALQWDGGILELVYKTYASVDPRILAPVTLSCNGLLGIRFHDLPGILKNNVLPVSKNFVPSLTPTPFYIHLFHEEKMYFQHCERPSQNWEKEQAEKMNVFYDAIGEAIFYPTPHQQKCIYNLTPMLEEVVALKSTAEDTDRKMQQLDASVSNLRKLNRTLKRKFNASEEQLKNLQRRHIEYLEKENDKLRKRLVEEMKS